MLDVLLRSLATNRDVEGWESTATNWLIAATVVAVIMALLMVVVKWGLKQQATSPREKTWSRGRSVTFVLYGLLPVALIVGITWYLSLDFHTIAGVPGLFKGIFVAWILYTGCMLVAHATAWRNDLF
jgi:hypothetical protein